MVGCEREWVITDDKVLMGALGWAYGIGTSFGIGSPRFNPWYFQISGACHYKTAAFVSVACFSYHHVLGTVLFTGESSALERVTVTMCAIVTNLSQHKSPSCSCGGAGRYWIDIGSLREAAAGLLRPAKCIFLVLEPSVTWCQPSSSIIDTDVPCSMFWNTQSQRLEVAQQFNYNDIICLFLFLLI